MLKILTVVVNKLKAAITVCVLIALASHSLHGGDYMAKFANELRKNGINRFLKGDFLFKLNGSIAPKTISVMDVNLDAIATFFKNEEIELLSAIDWIKILSLFKNEYQLRFLIDCENINGPLNHARMALRLYELATSLQPTSDAIEPQADIGQSLEKLLDLWAKLYPESIIDIWILMKNNYIDAEAYSKNIWPAISGFIQIFTKTSSVDLNRAVAIERAQIISKIANSSYMQSPLGLYFMSLLKLVSTDVMQEYTVSALVKLTRRASISGAIFFDDVSMLKDMMLANSTDINGKTDVCNISIIDFCALTGARECLKFVIANNGKITLDTLKMAILSGNVDIVVELFTSAELFKAADELIQERDSNVTIMAIAVLLRDVSVIDALIVNGFSVDYSSSRSMTPFIVACMNRYIDIALMLKNMGADVNAMVRGRPLCAFIADESVEMPKKVKMEILHFLLSINVDIDAKDYNGNGAIHMYAKSANKEALDLLIQNNATVDLVNNNNETPMLLAARKGCEEIVRLLLLAGANPNMQSNSGETPMHFAAQYCDRRVNKALIYKSANLNARDGNGNTPLHLSAVNDDSSMFELLIKHGASDSIRNNLGQTPAEYRFARTGIAASGDGY